MAGFGRMVVVGGRTKGGKQDSVDELAGRRACQATVCASRRKDFQNES